MGKVKHRKQVTWICSRIFFKRSAICKTTFESCKISNFFLTKWKLLKQKKGAREIKFVALFTAFSFLSSPIGAPLYFEVQCARLYETSNEKLKASKNIAPKIWSYLMKNHTFLGILESSLKGQRYYKYIKTFRIQVYLMRQKSWKSIKKHAKIFDMLLQMI